MMGTSIDTIAPGFLIASPLLKDPNFERTVVLMCIHNEEGAMGLVINRPSPLSIGEIMGQLELDCAQEISQKALVGGPVALNSGLLLYGVVPDSSIRDDELSISDELRLCPSRELLQEISKGAGPPQFHMFLGHAGWGPGQLESEISQGAWIPAQLRLELIFEIPLETRWEDALESEGLNPGQMSASRPQA